MEKSNPDPFFSHEQSTLSYLHCNDFVSWLYKKLFLPLTPTLGYKKKQEFAKSTEIFNLVIQSSKNNKN